MEITLHPFVKQILECAVRLIPDNAQRRWALDWACSVGSSTFIYSIGPHTTAETDSAKALFRLVSPAPRSAEQAIPPAPPPALSRPKRAWRRRRPHGEVALPGCLTRILECAAALTLDNQERVWALRRAAAVGELFFPDEIPTATETARDSRLAASASRRRPPRGGARPASRRRERR